MRFFQGQFHEANEIFCHILFLRLILSDKSMTSQNDLYRLYMTNIKLTERRGNLGSQHCDRMGAAMLGPLFHH